MIFLHVQPGCHNSRFSPHICCCTSAAALHVNVATFVPFDKIYINIISMGHTSMNTVRTGPFILFIQIAVND